MISDQARSLASERLAQLERRLGKSDKARNGNEPTTADLARRVAARLIERGSTFTPHLNLAQASSCAERLVGLEWRAVRAEVGLGRMRGRRLYRFADVVAGWVRRPWRLGFLFGGLRSAMGRLRLPELGAEPGVGSVLDELKSHVVASDGRRLPYRHLRVAHVGRLSMFGRVASCFDVATVDLEAELDTGFDFLLVESGVDDPLDGLSSETLDLFEETQIRVLFVVRTQADLDSLFIDRADLVLTEDPELADQAQTRGMNVLHIDPSVDDTIHNPIGWKQSPQHELMVIADHPGITTDLELLTPIADRVSVYGAEIPGLNPVQHIPQRPIGTNQNETAKNHLAAYTTPQLTATPTSHTQLVLELAASGTPIISRPDPDLARLLDSHYLTATTPADIENHLAELHHSPTRERHSIPARRHVLTNHTRTHRFEQILTHLNIPTNPQPKISILLATKRPEYVEHALNSVTTQNWQNKELVLILHGDNFDHDHIQTLTHKLSYPTHTITCPNNMIFGDALNQGLHHATGTYISKMDDDDHYGPNHLTDLHTAHTYSNATIVGKLASVVHIDEVDLTVSRKILDPERYHHHVAGPTLTGTRDTFEEYKFLRRGGRIDTTLLERVKADDGSIFVTHPYGFILERREEGHTWELEGYEHFVKNAVEIDTGVSDLFLGSG